MSFVESRAKSHNIDDDFEHLVAHAMSCTLESGVECATENRMLRFGSLDQVLNDDDVMRFMEGMVKHGSRGFWRQQATEVHARPGGASWIDRAASKMKIRIHCSIARLGQACSLGWSEIQHAKSKTFCFMRDLLWALRFSPRVSLWYCGLYKGLNRLEKLDERPIQVRQLGLLPLEFSLHCIGLFEWGHH